MREADQLKIYCLCTSLGFHTFFSMLNQVIFHLLSGSLAESSFSKTFTIRLKLYALFLNSILSIIFPHVLKNVTTSDGVEGRVFGAL